MVVVDAVEGAGIETINNQFNSDIFLDRHLCLAVVVVVEVGIITKILRSKKKMLFLLIFFKIIK